MEIKEVFKNLIEKLKSLFQKIINFCRENPRKALIAGCSVCIVILVLILISIIVKTPEPKKTEPEQVIVFTQDLLVPDEMDSEYSYDISRQTQENWTEEETEKWFTIPTPDQVEQLEKENESMISDVIGAAP
ncbi:MAG: hypothetical protein J6X54_02470 [Treponema sp.]|nr:hypothetical protein [Treponema sp.]